MLVHAHGPRRLQRAAPFPRCHTNRLPLLLGVSGRSTSYGRGDVLWSTHGHNSGQGAGARHGYPPAHVTQARHEQLHRDCFASPFCALFYADAARWPALLRLRSKGRGESRLGCLLGKCARFARERLPPVVGLCRIRVGRHLFWTGDNRRSNQKCRHGHGHGQRENPATGRALLPIPFKRCGNPALPRPLRLWRFRNIHYF